MRLNETTFPILKTLRNFDAKLFSDGLLACLEKQAGSLDPDNKEVKAFIGASTFVMKEAEATDISYISKTFHKAIVKAAPKIVETNKSYLEDAISCRLFLNENGGTAVFASDKDKNLKMYLDGFNKNEIVGYATINSDDYAVGGYAEIEWLKYYSVLSSVGLELPERDVKERFLNWEINSDGKEQNTVSMH